MWHCNFPEREDFAFIDPTVEGITTIIKNGSWLSVQTNDATVLKCTSIIKTQN